MQTLRIVSCLLIFCGPLIPTEVACDPSDPQLELLFSLAWGGKNGPQLSNRVKSSLTQGPTSVALGPQGKIWILDNQANRLLAYDNSGCLLEVVALTPGHRDDLAVGHDGSLALLARHTAKIEILGKNGRPKKTIELAAHLGPPRRIGFTQEIQVENAHGERFALGRPDDLKPLRQVLFNRRQGPIGSLFDCAVSVANGKVSLYRWGQPSKLTAERRPADHIIDLELDGVASARLVSSCSSRGMLVEVQRLEDGPVVKVSKEIVFVQDWRPATTWQLPGSSRLQQS
ncbi:MAG: hypothetical protein JRJ19_05415, partial [Deltaproteobacteria bacterium]|nr:hypothetical protein [Deltaproteobacteria bacterium]